MLNSALILLIIISDVNVNKLPNISKPQNHHLQNNFQNNCWNKSHLSFLFSVILTQYSVTSREMVSGEVISHVYLDVILFVVPCRSWLDSWRKSCRSDPASKSGCCYGEFLFFLFVLQRLHLCLLFQWLIFCLFPKSSKWIWHYSLRI